MNVVFLFHSFLVLTVKKNIVLLRTSVRTLMFDSRSRINLYLMQINSWINLNPLLYSIFRDTSLKVPTMNIEIKGSRLTILYTKVPNLGQSLSFFFGKPNQKDLNVIQTMKLDRSAKFLFDAFEP